MHSQLSSLIELQALDLRILEIKEQDRKIPALLQASETPLEQARQHLRTVTVLVDALTKERRDRERDLEAHEAQVGKLRARLMELKTNKEYQAHLFEIEMANKKKGGIEEQILTLMERIEAQQEEAKQAKVRATEAEGLFTQEKIRLEALAAGLRSELSQLDQKQKEIASRIDTNLLSRYTKLKAARKELALAPIRNGICVGCRLQLPPQLVAEVKRSDDLQTCTYCHRILYWEGEPVSVPASVAGRDEDPEETI
ncbi:MAG TPA: C4-type zinc ribbon domain-containing protein [Nitrospiraceae bacterium]|nr:C4-type zinc ribbon domain-containing protein [Nitrospiraceae bacterium]